MLMSDLNHQCVHASQPRLKRNADCCGRSAFFQVDEASLWQVP